MRSLYRVLTILILTFTVNCAVSQEVSKAENVLDTPIVLTNPYFSLMEFTDFVDVEYGILLTFDSKFLDSHKEFKIPKSTKRLEDVLKIFLTDVDYKFFPKDNKRLLINLNRKKEYKTIEGIVTDELSGEILQGVVVFDNYNASSYTNDNGLYKIKMSKNVDSLSFSYLGYEDLTVPLNNRSQRIDVALKYVNEFTPIVIQAKIADEFSMGSSAKIIDISSDRFETQLPHENDVVKLLKLEAGVQSGSEGENGFVVRGGTYDKNLMLIDDVPIQEINHSLGLSSILFPTSIKSMELFKESAPARYGGRVGAVLDVKLKDGHRKQQKVEFEVDAKHITIGLNGPLKENRIMYNLYLRESILDTYLPSLFSRSDYDDNSNINYGDMLGKMSYIPKNGASKIEIFGGYSRDEMIFSKTDVKISDLVANIKNGWDWSSRIASIRYKLAPLDSDFRYDFHVAGTQYLYLSSGSYSFEKIDENSPFGTSNVFGTYSKSDLANLYAKFNVNYDFKNHAIEAGVNYHRVGLSTTLLEDKGRFDYGLDNLLSDSDEVPLKLTRNITSAFIEDVYRYKRNLQIFGGIRLTFFDLYYNNYVIQPRLKIKYQFNPNYLFYVSFDRNVQFLHSLINTGVGIPVNLFVGSDNRIYPQISNQINMTHAFEFYKNKVEISAYYKKYNNQVDYNTSNNFSQDYNSNVDVIYKEPNDWRYYVTRGTEYTYGLEFSLRRDIGKVSSWITYAYTRHLRKYPKINNGRITKSRFDRPVDLNIGFNYELSKSWAIGSQFVYGSGNPTDFAFKVYTGAIDIPQLASNENNDLRLGDYHKMNIYGRYKYSSESRDLSILFGLNNVYDQRNVYYIYLYSDGEGDYNIRKFSLFPILPVINCKYSF